MTRDHRPDAGPGLEPETRAEVARRRLAQLATSFENAERGAAPSHRAHDGRATNLRGVHVRVITVVAVAAGILLTWWVLAERPRTADVTDPVELSRAGQTQPGPSEAGPSASGSAQVVVDVAGKVRRPGIVTLPAGSRVHQAIRAAGGTRGRGDLTGLNLARVLTDGEQVLVGVEQAPAGAGSGGGASGGAGAAVNLNSATLEELDSLPGVGPVTAQSIIDWRTENGRFRSVDDLLEVSGIGDKTLADLRDLVTV